MTAPIGSHPRLLVLHHPLTILLLPPLLAPLSPPLLHLAKAVSRLDLLHLRQAVHRDLFVPQNLLPTSSAHPGYLILAAIDCSYCLLGRHPHPARIVRDYSQAKAAADVGV